VFLWFNGDLFSATKTPLKILIKDSDIKINNKYRKTVLIKPVSITCSNFEFISSIKQYMPLIKINPVHAYKLKELFFIITYWIIMVRLVVILEFFSLESGGASAGVPKAFQILRDNLSAATSAGFIIGLLTGLSELYIFQKFFRNKSLYKLILTKFLVYLVCILLIGFVTLLEHQIASNDEPFLDALAITISYFTSNGFYHIIILGGLLSIGINFLLIMKNNIGHAVFIPIIVGRYHTPKEENRIFLFVDLKSSIQMAEQLGHVKYSQLIQDCFKDLSELVVKFRGAIYQFVGDEAVITWKTKRKDNYKNSILLFFAFEKMLKEKSDFYQNKYGIVPQFKAAVNSGKVMAAEVGGTVKSEIAYHGDVLNTASRMMELCKSYQKNLMLSENMLENVDGEIQEIKFEFQGELKLRGIDKKMNVYSGCEIHINSSTS